MWNSPRPARSATWPAHSQAGRSASAEDEASSSGTGWLHLSPAAFKRAEAWFARHGKRAVFLGRITPLVRSFISIPAGVLGSPLGPYTLLTLAGSLLWCFAFAAVGWAASGSWESIHHNLRYADYAVVAAV